MWLSKHRGSESGDLRLSGDYNSNKSRWHWYVFKPASIEQIESELQESVHRFVERREKKLVGKGLDERLRQIEKDQAALHALDEQRRVAESEREYKEREAANAQAIKAIDAVEKRPSKYVYLAPRIGHFIFEGKTEKRCDDLRALGFKASMGYLSPSRFIIWIDGDPNMTELKRTAERFLLKIYESEKPRASAKASASEQIWDAEHERWLPPEWYEMDHTSIRHIRKALELDRPRGGDPIHLKPLSQAWSPFNTVGCTPRVTTYTDADAFDAYRKASKEAADFGY